MTPLLFPKPLPRLLEQQHRAAETASRDRAESAKVRARSLGRCEVIERVGLRETVRCPRRAAEVHHLIGGTGRRNVGPSILAMHKLHACPACHRLITGHVLQPIDGQLAERADAVVYKRRRS